MKRLASLLALALAALTAAAGLPVRSLTPGCRLAAGDTLGVAACAAPAATRRSAVEVRAVVTPERPRQGLWRGVWTVRADNGLAATVQRGSRDFGYETGTDFTRVTVTSGDSLLATVDLDEAVGGGRGDYATLALEFGAGGEAAVLCGSRGLSEVWRGRWSMPAAYVAEAGGAAVEIASVAVEAEPLPALALEAYDPGEVAERLAMSTDRREGLWRHLDRVSDERLARPGGLYTLALLALPGGQYDIIYMDGARVNADAWTPGRVKGRLTPTPVPGRYTLAWVEATLDEGPDESQALLDADGGLLTLEFPLLRSTLRFARAPGLTY